MLGILELVDFVKDAVRHQCCGQKWMSREKSLCTDHRWLTFGSQTLSFSIVKYVGGLMGTKKAVITIRLVKECVDFPDDVIEEEILKELNVLKIPWMDKVVSVFVSDEKGA